MYLVIDNTASEKLVFFVSREGKTWNKQEFPPEKNGGLLVAIEKVLLYEKIAIQELKGIAVKVGTGKFTSTRLAVTVGNTLAFALKIPILAEIEIELSQIAGKLQKTPVGQYALPIYSGLPRLGGKN